MPRLTSTLVVLTTIALLSQVAVAGTTPIPTDNAYPVVLVHGFGGWGRSEMLGFKYWGGNNNDYQGDLHTAGFTNVMTAEIGPFSSNWDRACELYAQIKGGRVDYGANHATKHGHARYGRTFPGLFPQWGTVVNGKLQKVHLIGHSMGGQTIRMLAQLLNKGTAGAPIAEDPASHPLFAGGKDWVHSVTTVSTPNQGTTIADTMATTIDKIEKALLSWFGAGSLIGGASIFDAKLDQWAVTPRATTEIVGSYVHRIFSSAFFAATNKDNSRTDLTTAGAKAINAWVKTLPNIYYYSISSQDTFSFINLSLKKVQMPNPLTMLLPLQPCGMIMGSRATVDAGFPESWMANDGQVNVPSQLSDGTGKVVAFSSASNRGVWNQYPTKNYCDHFAIAGNSLYYDTYDIFRNHIRVLLSLPAHELFKRRLSEDEEFEEVHYHSDDIVQDIVETHRSLEERGRLAAVRQCQENKGLTREQTEACGRFLEVMAPGTKMAPSRMLRSN